MESSSAILNLSWDVIRYLAAEAADNCRYAYGQEPLVLFRTACDVGYGESEGEYATHFGAGKCNYHLEAMKFAYLCGAISD